MENVPRRRKNKKKNTRDEEERSVSVPISKKGPATKPEKKSETKSSHRTEKRAKTYTWKSVAFLCVRAVAILLVYTALDSLWRRWLFKKPAANEWEQMMRQICPDGPQNCPYGTLFFFFFAISMFHFLFLLMRMVVIGVPNVVFFFSLLSLYRSLSDQASSLGANETKLHSDTILYLLLAALQRQVLQGGGDGSGNVSRRGHGAWSNVSTGEFLAHGSDHAHAPALQRTELRRCERVLPHLRVHRWSHQHWPVESL